MTLLIGKIIDISLELDPKNFAMRTPAGFKKDMQFELEVIKEHDAPGGAGQIVRGVHMRLHAGSHIDAPEHNVPGGTQVHQLPLDLFIGDAIIADLRHKLPGKDITEADLEQAVGSRIRKGDRLLLRTDHNDIYHGNDEPGAPRVFHNSRTLSEHGIITMPYLKNLDRISVERFTLIGLPLNLIGAEASPVRAVALV